MATFLAVFAIAFLLNWGSIGPTAFTSRMGLIAVLVAGSFVLAYNHPLGVRRFRYVTRNQVAQILERGRCEWCREKLFHTAT
jgi:hypothetical protein